LTNPPDWLPAGRVGRPHGLDGSFYVTRPRTALLALGRVIRVGEVETEIVRLAGTDARPILRVAIAGDREAVEALRGADLFARRADAPALEPDEYWAEDLEGCRVVDGEREVGVVTRLVNLPSCDVLEVGDLLIPMVHDAVRSIDVEARVIDVDLGFLPD
jgi:16S rRNA processing protein RimM